MAVEKVTRAIVNIVTTVGCRYYPWHTGWNGKGTSLELTEFGPGTKHDFNCYQVGECIGGNWLVLPLRDDSMGSLRLSERVG